MEVPKKNKKRKLKMVAGIYCMNGGNSTFCDIWLIDSAFKMTSMVDLLGYKQLEIFESLNLKTSCVGQTTIYSSGFPPGINYISQNNTNCCLKGPLDKSHDNVTSDQTTAVILTDFYNRIKEHIPKSSEAIQGMGNAMTLNPFFGALLLQTLKRSSKFCSGFVRHIRETFPPVSEKELGNFLKTNCLNLEIYLKWPENIPMDFAWCYRVSDMVVRRLILDEAMAWLSTLGGAYSALGEYFEFHAQEAGNVSMKQLKVAMQVGDPISVAKCKVFYAQSLVQQGNWKLAKKIVRYQHHFAVTAGRKDNILVSMCHALWAKLQYLHKQKKMNSYSNNPER